MATISSVSNVAAAQQISQTNQIQQKYLAQQQKPPQNPPVQDTVQLSKAALSALGSGDVDHDGDSH